MIAIVIRFIKRFTVLLPGLVIAYLSIFNIFPWLNDHLPAVAAGLVTYIVGAYLLVPAVIRVGRIFFPSSHLPLYCVTPDGFASDPLNIGLIGTRDELIAAMTSAGWYEADHHSWRNMLREALSTVYGWSYPKAPMSPLFLFGRMQDVGFQIPIPGGQAGSRHHVRFWATSFDENKRLHVRTIDWRHRKQHVRGDRLLWVGAASRDIGVSFIRHNAQITHMIDPDTDSERELIVRQLQEIERGTVDRKIKLGDPYKLTNRVWRGYLQTDGQMTIMRLKAPTPSRDSARKKRQPATKSLVAQR